MGELPTFPTLYLETFPVCTSVSWAAPLPLQDTSKGGQGMGPANPSHPPLLLQQTPAPVPTPPCEPSGPGPSAKGGF